MRRVSKHNEEKPLMQVIKNLKFLIHFKTLNGFDIEDTINFPKVEKPLTVVWSGQGGQQIWDMIDVANNSFGIFLTKMFFNDSNSNKLKLFCFGRFTLFVHPSL